MAMHKKICRVCGASYKACLSLKAGSSVFNWREVACSPECGTVYFAQIAESRASTKNYEVPVAESVPDEIVEKPTSIPEEVELVFEDVPEDTSMLIADDYTEEDDFFAD